MKKLIALCGCLMLGVAWGGDGQAQEKLNVAYISPTPSGTSIFWVAKEAGLYKKHGLDVSLIYIDGTPKALPALLAGELQIISATGPAVVNARLSGGDVTMIMGLEVTLPYYLVAAPEITRVAELKGKIGATHIAATSADFAMRLGLRSLGLDPDRDVQLRAVGATNLRLAALKQKMAHFTVFTVAEKEAAEALGFKVLANFARDRIPYPHTGVATSGRSLRERRETVLRFGRAIVDTIQYFKTHKAESVAVMKKYSKLENVAALERAYDWTKQALHDAPYPTIEGVKLLLAEIGRTRPEALRADPASFADTSIVGAVEEERRRR